MLDFFAEFETNLCRERQAEGISPVKNKGVYKGRSPEIDIAAIKRRRTWGERPVYIARDMGVARSTIHRARALL